MEKIILEMNKNGLSYLTSGFICDIQDILSSRFNTLKKRNA